MEMGYREVSKQLTHPLVGEKHSLRSVVILQTAVQLIHGTADFELEVSESILQLILREVVPILRQVAPPITLRKRKWQHLCCCSPEICFIVIRCGVLDASGSEVEV